MPAAPVQTLAATALATIVLRALSTVAHDNAELHVRMIVALWSLLLTSAAVYLLDCFVQGGTPSLRHTPQPQPPERQCVAAEWSHAPHQLLRPALLGDTDSR